MVTHPPFLTPLILKKERNKPMVGSIFMASQTILRALINPQLLGQICEGAMFRFFNRSDSKSVKGKVNTKIF